MLFASWNPDNQKAQKTLAVVQSIDFAATILAACGVAGTADLPGINLLKMCDGQPAARDTVCGSTFLRLIEYPRGRRLKPDGQRPDFSDLEQYDTGRRVQIPR
ncbi:MAG: hypothetical protein ACT4QC_21010 [Planctomycetaceae bacterium]